MAGQLLPLISARTVAPARSVVKNLVAVETAPSRYRPDCFARTQGFTKRALNLTLRAVDIVAHDATGKKAPMVTGATARSVVRI
jgi:hypothetical protein